MIVDDASTRAASADADEPTGRDPTTGRFAAGNTYGRGNPLATRQAEYRQAIQDAATADELRAVVAAMVKKARNGDVAAGRLVLEYTAGRPVPLVETLDEPRYGVRIYLRHEDQNGDDFGQLKHEADAHQAAHAARMSPRDHDEEE